MGKNPNANRDKKKKFTQKDPSAAEKLEVLQLEAARRGIEIWELQKEQEEEEAKVRVMRRSERPSDKEVEEHMMTHLPYREWCNHCVKGKGVRGQHRWREQDEGEAPVISVDYMWMTQEEEKGMPIMVIKDRYTGVIKSRVVP